MRPQQLSTNIFLDSGNPADTEAIFAALGFLDGQTTNPSLVAKNPEVRSRIESGKPFTADDLKAFYKTIVVDIAKTIPDGSISIEVYADEHSTVEELFEQGKEMFSWIPNAHIKYPITSPGLAAAERSVAEGMRVNMTLCFSQEQAAAVYAATRGAKRGSVFVSPFIGRLDDRGEKGMSLVRNIQQMYAAGDGHVEVLAASVRSLEHLYELFSLRTDIATAPLSVLETWQKEGMALTAQYAERVELKEIPFTETSLKKEWQSYDIHHELTGTGLKKFAEDWNRLLQTTT